jgi:hypothetical protein
MSTLKLTAVGQENAKAEWQDIGGSENSDECASRERAAMNSRPLMRFARSPSNRHIPARIANLVVACSPGPSLQGLDS